MPSPPAEGSLVNRIRAPDRNTNAGEPGTNPTIRHDLPLLTPTDVPQPNRPDLTGIPPDRAPTAVDVMPTVPV